MTSEMGEVFNQLRAERKKRRRLHGAECPVCKIKRPRTNASILLPGQKCRVDGYVDPRPRLPREERKTE